MKTAIPVIFALVLASATAAQAKPAANNPKDLIALEDAWAKAAVARDAAAMSRIVASDWHGQNQKGKMYDRAAMLKETLSGPEKLTSEVNHDLHVRFLGADHAVVQGMDDETGTKAGKAVKQTYSWTDVYEKRAGKWVAVASQATLIK